jgi:hypothetical protein
MMSKTVAFRFLRVRMVFFGGPKTAPGIELTTCAAADSPPRHPTDRTSDRRGVSLKQSTSSPYLGTVWAPFAFALSLRRARRRTTLAINGCR